MSEFENVPLYFLEVTIVPEKPAGKSPPLVKVNTMVSEPGSL